MIKECYSVGMPEIFKELESSEKGITDGEAILRQKQYGLNEIKEKKNISAFKILLAQLNSPVIWVLFAASILAAFLNEWIESGVILGILLINTVLGFIQEYKAEKSIEALKRLASLKAIVIRGGKEEEIDSKELVPGDIILLNEGSKVPADARIFHEVMLETQEAVLTGESVPVKKTAEIISFGKIIADQLNMVFSGTIITKGKGKAIVTSTGMSTEIGKIAKLIGETEEKQTPLQKNIIKLGKMMGIIVSVVCMIVFLTGLLKGQGRVIDMFIAAVALAVAAIPEGLPAIVTISLALGLKRMIKRNALIRKLPSVETLGSTTVICTDKTGTLTHNEMTVTSIYAGGDDVQVSGAGYSSKGGFSTGGKTADAKKIDLLLKIGALCNDASIEESKCIGDPTEGSLIVSASKAGLIKEKLDEEFPRIDEIPFSSERKMMTTIHKIDGTHQAYAKGAPDVILRSCSYVYRNGKAERLNENERRAILEKNDEFARKALRVIGFAYKDIESSFNFSEGRKIIAKEIEKDMVFVGMQAMIDPPREEVKEAISKCKDAGIKVVMITGDHKNTAMAVAKEIGISGRCITGEELDRINDLKSIVDLIGIYARVNPSHKMKIVEALQAKGHIVAMTGDGVNDAPALKNADIGISMGITGTDVAKEASHMVLTDDNFTSIVNAVEEGRGIFDNIKIFLKYLLIGNAAGILIVFLSSLMGLPLPLLALQILWFNLLTETIPSLALIKEPPEKDIMKRKPRKPEDNFITNKEISGMILNSLLITAGVLGVFAYILISNGWSFGQVINLNNAPQYYFYATTMAFTTLVFFQIFNVFNTKSINKSMFFEEIFHNRWLLFGAMGSILLQLAVVNIPVFNSTFNTTPLSISDWSICILISLSIIAANEIVKLISRIRSSKAGKNSTNPSSAA